MNPLTDSTLANPSPAEDAVVHSLHYQPAQKHHDEAYRPDGEIKRHWHYLLDSLNRLGTTALTERETKAQRILRDDGATYNVYHDPRGSRTWSLDPVPLVIDSEEWGLIETGLMERAELLNLLLKDIYSNRDLIRHGLIPPELLFSHAGFLRPCHDVQLPGEHQLLLHAADLVRTEDGSMCVLADRTQAPSGAGYALENRTVMSRILPSLFRDSHVHRLALFFRTLRLKLAELNPNRDEPNIVLLTPGSFNETYFEHAYLANYLGYTLVQGGDLAVRNGYVWMKSLEGLRRVDVILRRVDDYFCDPVELKSDSRLGVPGILEVARAGRVVLANPLGSGVLEHPALLKYLPDIARYYLGRELSLPSVPTYWCGDPGDQDYVLNHLRELVIKPTFRRSMATSIDTRTLSDEKLAALRADIMSAPFHYAAQPFLQPSQVPSWEAQTLQSRPAVLRSFAVASQTGYVLMPGGLTRVGRDEDVRVITSQAGSFSKDTWVVASEPEKQVTLRTDTRSDANFVSDQRTDLPSRVIENLFWFGRYAERAESALRLMRVVFVRLNGFELMSPAAINVMLRSVTQLTGTLPGFMAEDESVLAHPEQELLAIILDEQRPGTIAGNLVSLLNSAEQVRELLSADTQRVVSDIGDELGRLADVYSGDIASAPEEALDPLVTALMALAGLTQESMVRGMGWRFMELGRRIERALQTIALLRAMLVPVLSKSDEILVLESVLLSVEVLITYRRRYRAELAMRNGLELIMLDNTNPRSLLYQLERVAEHIQALPKQGVERQLSAEARSNLAAKTQIQLVDLLTLIKPRKGQTRREALDEWLQQLEHLLMDSAARIADKHFDHTEGPQPIWRSAWDE